MHWCPECGQACYCDCDDMDWGEDIPDDCPHIECEYGDTDEDYDYDEWEDD